MIEAQQRHIKLFLTLWAICFASFIISAITNQFQIGVRIFVSVFWCMFALANFEMHATGRINHKFAPKIIRHRQPLLFWIVSTIYTILSMGISSLLLFKAFTEEVKNSSH